jgi:hypothetical protein
MTNNNTSADNSSEQVKADEVVTTSSGFSLDWDSYGSDDDNGDDILKDAVAADVPKACSIDNPSCEACQ